MPRTVELDRAAPGWLADLSVPSRDAPLQQRPALRLPGDSAVESQGRCGTDFAVGI